MKTNLTFHLVVMYSLLSKIRRDEVRKRFIETLAKEIHQAWEGRCEEAGTLLECFMLVIHSPENISPRAGITSTTLNNIIPITEFWRQYVSRIRVKFSHWNSLSKESEEMLIQTLKEMEDSASKFEGFFKYLQFEMSEAEYRGVPYEEPLVSPPLNFLPAIGQRRTFFESLVPEGTQWRNK